MYISLDIVETCPAIYIWMVHSEANPRGAQISNIEEWFSDRGEDMPASVLKYCVQEFMES